MLDFDYFRRFLDIFHKSGKMQKPEWRPKKWDSKIEKEYKERWQECRQVEQ